MGIWGFIAGLWIGSKLEEDYQERRKLMEDEGYYDYETEDDYWWNV